MKTYRVRMNYSANNVQVEVEADNEDDAIEQAKQDGQEIAADWVACNQVLEC